MSANQHLPLSAIRDSRFSHSFSTTKPATRGIFSLLLRLALGVAFILFLVADSLVAAPKKGAKMPAAIPPGTPEIFELEPRGIQRGVATKIKLVGTNLIGLTEVELPAGKITGDLLDDPPATTNEAWIEITATNTLAPGPYPILVKNDHAQSSRLDLHVDNLPQAFEESLTNGAALKTPVSVWGRLDPPGDVDEVDFDASAGHSLVLHLAAKTIGSKAVATLSLFDDHGKLLAANSGFDGGDPLLQFQVPATGRYRARIGERTDSGSKSHFYRLSIGQLPVVVGCFPLGVRAQHEADVQLIGFNLPQPAIVHVKAGAPGEMPLEIDPEKFRARRPLKLVVNEGPELLASAQSHSRAQAMKIPVPCAVDGRIWPSAPDLPPVDLFRFEAKAGQNLVIETDAARRGSPIDTRIELLHPDGKPVERVLLQAVRDSHITFRAIDSNTDDLRVENWQEMELNQFMYLQGEVCKIFRMPQGPDSGFQFYNVQGKRRDYFDTSAVAHALDEPAYIVEPHPPGTKPAPNGLPAFPVYYANDDDAERMLGADSRLLLKVPADGDYIVRVTDTRGSQGERFAYRLIVREAKPDFKVTLNPANLTINPGSGKLFTLSAERTDGFDGDIRVDITGLPPGYSVSSPIVIQAGHSDARGTLHAAEDAVAVAETNAAPIKVEATAVIEGHDVSRPVNNFARVNLGSKPRLTVALEPYDETATNFVDRPLQEKPAEITIAPGQSIPAWLKIKRAGHDDLVTFTIENLPHGVIVDNIGLNGVLIPKDQNARQVFLTAARWVPETDRLCFAEAKQADNPTSLPVLIHIRKPAVQAAAP